VHGAGDVLAVGRDHVAAAVGAEEVDRVQPVGRLVELLGADRTLTRRPNRPGDRAERAQVVQAQACRLEADVRMNPILLKPNSDTGSQVIILGKPVGNMNVMIGGLQHQYAIRPKSLPYKGQGPGHPHLFFVR